MFHTLTSAVRSGRFSIAATSFVPHFSSRQSSPLYYCAGAYFSPPFGCRFRFAGFLYCFTLSLSVEAPTFFICSFVPHSLYFKVVAPLSLRYFTFVQSSYLVFHSRCHASARFPPNPRARKKKKKTYNTDKTDLDAYLVFKTFNRLTSGVAFENLFLSFKCT